MAGTRHFLHARAGSAVLHRLSVQAQRPQKHTDPTCQLHWPDTTGSSSDYHLYDPRAHAVFLIFVLKGLCASDVQEP